MGLITDFTTHKFIQYIGYRKCVSHLISNMLMLHHFIKRMTIQIKRITDKADVSANYVVCFTCTSPLSMWFSKRL